MQLMWLSGPTGRIQTISITSATIVRATLALAVFLVVMGFLLNLLGLRIAVEHNPELARNKFMEIAVPAGFKEKGNGKGDSLGGPLVPLKSSDTFFRQPLDVEIKSAEQDVIHLHQVVVSMQTQWQDQLNWLHALPLGIPVGGEFRYSSGFGVRHDPFTGQLAMHEGIDFSAEAGTPVISSADGVVVRSAWDASYGNVVEVRHGEDYVTRYAHMRKRLVEEGDHVVRGGQLGELGTTGRSTGPHLHYEMFKNGKLINPIQIIPITSG